MSYKLSERKAQSKLKKSHLTTESKVLGSQNKITKDTFLFISNLQKVFIFFGVLSLLTAFILGTYTTNIYNTKVNYFSGKLQLPQIPIKIKQYDEVYEIKFSLNKLPSYNNWFVIEGELLDQNQNSVVFFNKELWKEYDSSVYETDLEGSIDVSFHKPGNYYLSIRVAESSIKQSFQSGSNIWIDISVNKVLGSFYPHLIFAFILLILFGIFGINFIKKLLKKYE